MCKFKKKPLEIEAVQFLDNAETIMELTSFIKGQDVDIKRHGKDGSYLIIKTLEGDMKANEYDFIIKGVNGEYYPCKPDIFEKSYDIVSSKDMTFGEALEALINGKKVCRKGWNGKGMFVIYQKGYPNGIPCNKQTAEAWGLEEGDLFKVEPYLQIRMVNGSHSMWIPSINDCLANDWRVV